MSFFLSSGREKKPLVVALPFLVTMLQMKMWRVQHIVKMFCKIFWDFVIKSIFCVKRKLIDFHKGKRKSNDLCGRKNYPIKFFQENEKRANKLRGKKGKNFSDKSNLLWEWSMVWYLSIITSHLETQNVHITSVPHVVGSLLFYSGHERMWER